MRNLRQSNFELLRIIAMVMIVGGHGFGSIDAVNLLPNGQFAGVIYHLLRVVFALGVNLFALITGYFLINRNGVSVRKVIMLLLDVAIYGVVMYGISILLGINTFHIKGFVKAMFPIIAGYRWFVLAYCVVYLIAPLLNGALTRLSRKQYVTFLVIYTLFFSVWPTFLPNPPMDDYGYSFHHLVYMYLLGGYIRLHTDQVRKDRCCLILMGSTAILTLFGVMKKIPIPLLSAAAAHGIANNSIFMVTASVAMFMLFKTVNFQSKLINVLAASAFPVYLIHGDYNTMDYLFNELLHMDTVLQWPLWFVWYLLYIVGIYLVCAMIDQMKQRLVNKPISVLLERISFCNYKITSMEEKI